MTPAQFIAHWKDSPLTERAGAQAHFDDLSKLLGLDKPRDPDNYCFERGAKKTSGRPHGKPGWADVWKRDRVILMKNCLAMLFALCVGTSLSSVFAAETVLVVSIDALHPAALSARTSPTLHALMQSGTHTLNGRSVDPPKTLIAHTAMMTGLPPAQNGKLDNEWQPGEPTVAKRTLFDDAKLAGYRTAFYYSKPKLGYLVNAAVDEHGLEPSGGITPLRSFFKGEGKRFAFLHFSGLEWVGKDSGWLSQAYLDELSDIDAALAPMFEEVRQRGRYAIVVTSDHAGHDKLHGTQHPEDYKLPLIVAGNVTLPRLPAGTWPVTELRALVQKLER